MAKKFTDEQLSMILSHAHELRVGGENRDEHNSRWPVQGCPIPLAAGR